MNADGPIAKTPRKVQVRIGAQNAAQAKLERLARGLPRWAARLARKAARNPQRSKKAAPPAEPSEHFHYHAD
jgi:hypothetical protein